MGGYPVFQAMIEAMGSGSPVGAIPIEEKGAPNGVPTLDAEAKIPLGQMRMAPETAERFTLIEAEVADKQPAGSYVTTANFTWANLSDKPTNFAPSAHNHPISEVTGLQEALDGKQPTGAYLTSINSGMVTTALGYTPQAAGNYATGGGTATGTNTGDQFTAMTAARFLGRVTAGFGAAEQLTGTQATALLNTFDQTTKGLVPPPSTISGRFLKDDGTWASAGGGADPWTLVKQAADHVNATVTPSNVSGMAITVAANTVYLVEIFGTVLAAANTTGVGLDFDIPSGRVMGLGFHHGTTAGSIVGFEQIADAANAAVSSGVRAAATESPFYARFWLEVGTTGGTAQLQFRAEVAASATLKAGTRMMHRTLAS